MPAQDGHVIGLMKTVKPVRLSSKDLAVLQKSFVEHFMPGDRLWLFGSLVDLQRRGGDIDLYVETQASTADKALRMRSACLNAFEDVVGEQKVDMVINMLKDPYPLAIHEVALNEGVRLL